MLVRSLTSMEDIIIRTVQLGSHAFLKMHPSSASTYLCGVVNVMCHCRDQAVSLLANCLQWLRPRAVVLVLVVDDICIIKLLIVVIMLPVVVVVC